MRPKTPSTIRFQLTCLVLAAILPVWLVSGLLVFHAYSAKRDQVNSTMLDTAQSLTMVVDRELTSVQAALLALATSPTFASGDFASVHHQALELLKSYPGADIIVADVTGQQLVNSYRPYGDPLPKRKTLETVRRIFETGKPVISDLFHGAVTKRPMIGIDVPVFRDGKVAYDLAMTFPSDRMVAVLLQQSLPPDWYSTILDTRQIVVARSHNPNQYVGRKVNPALLQALSLATKGTVEATNLEGTPVFATFCRSAMSRWSVVIGVPRTSVMAGIYQWVWWAIAGATLISLFGITLAVVYARRIAQGIQSLVDPALSIGRGELAAAGVTNSVREIGTVSAALVQASDLLQARARELAQSRTSLEEQMTERQQAANALKELNDTLEKRIVERTEQITSVNETLRIEITERKQAEEALRESEERFRLFLDNNPSIVWIKDEQGRHVYLNKTYEERFGVRLADWRGKSDAEVWPADVAAEFRKNDLAVLEADRSIQITEDTINPDGSNCHWLNTKFPYRDATGNRFIAAIGLDITERKRTEAYRAMGQEILLMLNQFDDLNEGMQEIIDILRTTTGVEAVGIRLQQGDDYPYFSQRGFSQDFLSKENSLVTRMRDGGICMDEDGNPCLECTCGMVICGKIDPASPQCTRGGSIWTNDSYDILTLPPSEDPRSNPRNECIHHGYASVALIPIRAKGTVVGLLQLNDCRKDCFSREDIEALELIAENIGEAMLRKQAEYELKASLHEKEVLLKEIHHRVKNNLQVISSLVSLQSDGSKDETVHGVLRDVTFRVRSMALVHEKLYQSNDLAHVDFAEYTKSLLNYLWSAHGAVAANVRLTLDLEKVSLPVDTAVPCGLILNELAGNALKHAFQGRSEGKVTVSLHTDEDGRTHLSVADNGVGLPTEFNWRESKSLGLRLVQMLSGQIDATVEVICEDKGTRFDMVWGEQLEHCVIA